MRHYLRRDFELPASWEERFSALQWAAGCAGVEIRGDGIVLEMSVFFAPEVKPPAFDAAAWREKGIRLLVEEEQEDLDWAASYRARAEPVRIGKLVLDPREPDSDPPDLKTGESWLRLPARTAFGTGSHASTRLAIELLGELCVEGKRVLDVGTGTGVLAFVAFLGGAEEILAFDVDPAAALVARENAGLNAMKSVRFFAGRLAALSGSGHAGFDLVLINILPHNVREELAQLDSLVASSADLVFSGLTVDTERELRRLLEELGWNLAAHRRDEEWVALAFRRQGPE